MKLYFLQHEHKLLGCSQNTPRSVVFGFKNRGHVDYVKQHVRYLSNDFMECTFEHKRYLIKTHYNDANGFDHKVERESLKIISRNIYEAVVMCNLNRLSLNIVNHICDREDGDIELSCFKVRDMVESIDEDILKYNLEMLYQNNFLN